MQSFDFQLFKLERTNTGITEGQMPNSQASNRQRADRYGAQGQRAERL